MQWFVSGGGRVPMLCSGLFRVVGEWNEQRAGGTRLWYTQNTTDYFHGDATVLIISVIHRFIIAIM